ARAVQAVFAGLGFPAVTDEEVDAATYGYASWDVPDRDRAADVTAADRVMDGSVSALDVVRELDQAGFADVAEAVLGMQRQRVSADYLQTSAIIEPDGTVRSAVSDPNLYEGPGTGYRLEGDRWQLLQQLPYVLDPAAAASSNGGLSPVRETHVATMDDRSDDVVIAVGPAFAATLRETINGLAHADVLHAVVDGVLEGGARPRLVRVRRVSDVAFIGHDGAKLSGSGIAVGLQSKGTAVIH